MDPQRTPGAQERRVQPREEAASPWPSYRPRRGAAQRKPALPTSRSWTCSLWNCEKTRFYRLSHPVSGILLWQPGQTNEYGDQSCCVRQGPWLGLLELALGVPSQSPLQSQGEESWPLTYEDGTGLPGHPHVYMCTPRHPPTCPQECIYPRLLRL